MCQSKFKKGSDVAKDTTMGRDEEKEWYGEASMLRERHDSISHRMKPLP